MFIELAEFLRCPEDHEAATCVVVPQQMRARDVLRGTIGCSECRREYPIENGVARFGGVRKASPPGTGGPAADAIHAMMGLSSPGGYAVLLGEAGARASALSGLLDGVHFIGVNAPPSAGHAQGISLLETHQTLPLRDSMARAVVVGGDFSQESWIGEGVRVLLRGLRIVVCNRYQPVAGVELLAETSDVWVGQKQ